MENATSQQGELQAGGPPSTHFDLANLKLAIANKINLG